MDNLSMEEKNFIEYMESGYDPIQLLDDLEMKYLEEYRERLKVGAETDDIEYWKDVQVREFVEFKKRIEPEMKLYRKMVKDKIVIDLVDHYNERKRESINELSKRISRVSIDDRLKLKELKENDNRRIKQEIEDIKTVAKYPLHRRTSMEASMKLNRIEDRRFLATLTDTVSKVDNAVQASFRTIDDTYRYVPMEAALIKSTNQITLVEAIDKANGDFLEKGLTSIRYKNGAEWHIRPYSEMVIKTNRHRATLRAEASIREELDIYLIMVSSHAISCPKCAPWQGKVLIDDVNTNPPQELMGKYPLLSYAMETGLLHPNCRHDLLPWKEEYALYDDYETDIPYTEEDLYKYEMEQKQRAIERKIRKLKRESIGSLDPNNKNVSNKLVKEAEKELREHLKENKYLRRKRWRERNEPID